MLIDDRVRGHLKFIRAGTDAAWLFICALGWSREQMTDGFIPDDILSSLWAGFKHPDRLAQRLVDARKTPDGAGLFERVKGGYQIHDFEEYNDSRDAILQRRRAETERKGRWRAQQSGSPVTPSPPDVPPGQTRDNSGTRDGTDNGTDTGPHAESHVLARAYPRLGVGSGVRTPEGGAGETSHVGTGDQLWQAWRETADAHGVPVALTPRGRELEGIHAVLALMPVEEARKAIAEFWRSPKWSDARHFNMFAANAGQLLAHAQAGKRDPFGVKPPPTSADPPRPRLKMAAEVKAEQAAREAEREARRLAAQRSAP